MLCFNWIVGFLRSVPVLSAVARQTKEASRRTCPHKRRTLWHESRNPTNQLHEAQRCEKSSPQLYRHVPDSSPSDLTFRANPFLDVTDLICRLPSPTFFNCQRLFTLETWCGYEYGLPRKFYCLAGIFKRRQEHSGHHKQGGASRRPVPHLRTSWLKGVDAILTKKRERQNRCGPPPEFFLASNSASIVHHLSELNVCALAPPWWCMKHKVTRLHHETAGDAPTVRMLVSTFHEKRQDFISDQTSRPFTFIVFLRFVLPNDSHTC